MESQLYARFHDLDCVYPRVDQLGAHRDYPDCTCATGLWLQCYAHGRTNGEADAEYVNDLVGATTLFAFEECMRQRSQQHPHTHLERVRSIEHRVREWDPHERPLILTTTESSDSK